MHVWTVKTLKEWKPDLYTVMHQLKVTQVSVLRMMPYPTLMPVLQDPGMDVAQLNHCPSPIASTLFKEDAFWDDGIFLKNPI